MTGPRRSARLSQKQENVQKKARKVKKRRRTQPKIRIDDSTGEITRVQDKQKDGSGVGKVMKKIVHKASKRISSEETPTQLGTTHLYVIPCADTPEMENQRKREMREGGKDLKARAEKMVHYIKTGKYPYGGDQNGEYHWAPEIKEAIKQKVSIPPERELTRQPNGDANILVQVTNETTLGAALRLEKDQPKLKVLALNFANGYHPGGGFLMGHSAQEESLCHTTALYATLTDDPMYNYNEHLFNGQNHSTDYAILSPSVPVAFLDDTTPLRQTEVINFLTCAAPVCTRKQRRQPSYLDMFRQRIRRILQIALEFRFDALVLGAWGCGAFGNDPKIIANLFKEELVRVRWDFKKVVFAILDVSKRRSTLGPFRDAFTN